jgi:DNA-binding GntR family transcriptional regulator
MTQTVPDILGHQPRYLQVANTLLNEIKTGRYPVGSFLPTEFELCDQFGVSRFTVREAIKQLVQQGLLVRCRGVGTQVCAASSNRGYVQVMSELSDLNQYVSETYLQVETSQVMAVQEPKAALLRASAGETWLHVDGLRFTREGDLPISHTEIYIAPQFRSIRGVQGKMFRPIYVMLEEQFRATIGVVEQEIQPVQITDDLCRRLRVPVRSLGLLLTRRYLDERGELVELAVSVHPDSRFTYRETFRRQWSASGSQ